MDRPTPAAVTPARKHEPSGYFALKTEILGLSVVWDVHYDYQPPCRCCDDRGYLDIARVLWNGTDITSALTKEMREAIREEMECARERTERSVTEDCA